MLRQEQAAALHICDNPQINHPFFTQKHKHQFAGLVRIRLHKPVTGNGFGKLRRECAERKIIFMHPTIVLAGFCRGALFRREWREFVIRFHITLADPIEFGLDERLLKLRQAFKKVYPIKMIDLVLNANGQQTISGFGLKCSFGVPLLPEPQDHRDTGNQRHAVIDHDHRLHDGAGHFGIEAVNPVEG